MHRPTLAPGAHSLQLGGNVLHYGSNSLHLGTSPIIASFFSRNKSPAAPVPCTGAPSPSQLGDVETGAVHPSSGVTPPATPHTGRPSLEAAGSGSGALPMHMSGPRLKMALPPAPQGGAQGGAQPPASPLREDAEEGQDVCLPGETASQLGDDARPEEEPLLAKGGKMAAGKAAGPGIGNDIVYGLINSLVGIPTMISFAAIIFKDELYAPRLGQLAKLAFLGSAVHQAVFTLVSTLPFAVGQVQDVGLIFLSAMATSIAGLCTAEGLTAEEALGTTLVTLVISTFLVGMLIVLVGYLKLASLVQYVPLPVVGGYLGYVGFFCLAAGISLACDVEIGSFASWGNLANVDALSKLAPTLAATLLLWSTMKFAPLCAGTRLAPLAPLLLPAALVAIPAAFQVTIMAMGVSRQQAADAGWVLQPTPGTPFWDVYRLFNISDWSLSGVYWRAVVTQAPKVVALFFVCAFGSSLDVAAIQAESPEPLDFNHELQTVGLSNIVTALSGAGLTGSYIFSQTIFSMRAGVHTRLHGWIIACAEMAVFLVPFGIVQYMPNLFYGALLALFGIEITMDWLIHSYRKVARAEFVLLWMTFLAIIYTDLETGIGAGVIFSVVYFAYSYAKVTVRASAVIPARSAVLRGPTERAVLDLMTARLAAVSLSGYIFFGSSVKISDQVMAVARALLAADDDVLEASTPHPALQGGAANSGARRPRLGRGAGEEALWAPGVRERTRAAFAAAPQFVMLDFRMVRGLDATAAQTFGTLRSLLQRQGIELLISELSNANAAALLTAHGVIGPDACRAFDKAEDGVHYCEERFLEVARRHGVLGLPELRVTLAEALATHATHVVSEGTDFAQLAADVRPYFTEATCEPGTVIIEAGEPARTVHFVEEGRVLVAANFLNLPEAQRAVDFPATLLTDSIEWTFQFGPGAVLGASDLFLDCPARFRAVAAERCRTLRLSQAGLHRLTAERPKAAIALVGLLLRTLALDNQHLNDFLARSNAGAS
ncbi:hypothetical protein WJX81_005443 [Elliptochloris bilobata]|uniref:Sulfate transporter n=1 Tax=Elliptochloris bilobata TaxID=381761 RepID=A0AAW1SK69_9CHLO